MLATITSVILQIPNNLKPSQTIAMDTMRMPPKPGLRTSCHRDEQMFHDAALHCPGYLSSQKLIDQWKLSVHSCYFPFQLLDVVPFPFNTNIVRCWN